jgi:hypothetical protein
MSELRANAQHLGNLATTQNQASTDIDAATKTTDGIGKEVWLTHGCYVGAANTKVSEAEEARRAAGQALQRWAASLGEKLEVARNSYARTDTQGKENLDNQMLDR